MIKQWLLKRQRQDESKAELAKALKRTSVSSVLDMIEQEKGPAARKEVAKKLVDGIDGITARHLGDELDPEKKIERYEQYAKDPKFRNKLKRKMPSLFHEKMVDQEMKAAWDHLINRVKHFSKSDLEKAVHEKNWKQIQSKQNTDYSQTVDHKPHMAQFPVHPEYARMLSDEKVFKGIGKRSDNGISAKMVHDVRSTPNDKGIMLSDTDRFMAKPYHKKMESATKAYVKHPILGWANMATKALFNAGGIGHLAEDVSTHEHNGVPLTVHKFAKNYSTVDGDVDYQLERTKPTHAQQIAIMDYLTNNLDRHAGNLMVSDHAGFAGKSNVASHNLLAIDHERNFQYNKPLWWKNRQFSTPYGGWANTTHNDSPMLHMAQSALDSVPSRDEPWTDSLDWWKEKGPHIRDEFNRQAEHIKDPDIREHVTNNFHNKWHAMNAWVHGLEAANTYGLGNLHETFPRVSNVPFQRKRITRKSLKEHLSKDKTQAMNMIADIANQRGDNLTSKQQEVLQNTADDVIKDMTPEEMTSFYRHAMENPKFNTSWIANSPLDPKRRVLNHLEDPDNWGAGRPKYKYDHIQAMNNLIDSTPHEKRGTLQGWRERFADILHNHAAGQAA